MRGKYWKIFTVEYEGRSHSDRMAGLLAQFYSAQPLLIVWILGDVTGFVITSLWVIAMRTEEDRNSAQSNFYKLKKQVEKSPKHL